MLAERARARATRAECTLLHPLNSPQTASGPYGEHRRDERRARIHVCVLCIHTSVSPFVRDSSFFSFFFFLFYIRCAREWASQTRNILLYTRFIFICICIFFFLSYTRSCSNRVRFRRPLYFSLLSSSRVTRGVATVYFTNRYACIIIIIYQRGYKRVIRYSSFFFFKRFFEHGVRFLSPHIHTRARATVIRFCIYYMQTVPT